ncbi:MAG: YgjV family protein [Flavobacteriia bacterium]|nr:YgjV family protein [Flavobacteriia bacterium]
MENLTEIIGYIASFLVLISFLMKDMKKLRIINIFGCGAFIIYGIMSVAIPVIITNTAIVIINIYYLLKRPN